MRGASSWREEDFDGLGQKKTKRSEGLDHLKAGLADAPRTPLWCRGAGSLVATIRTSSIFLPGLQLLRLLVDLLHGHADADVRVAGKVVAMRADFPTKWTYEPRVTLERWLRWGSPCSKTENCRWKKLFWPSQDSVAQLERGFLHNKVKFSVFYSFRSHLQRWCLTLCPPSPPQRSSSNCGLVICSGSVGSRWCRSAAATCPQQTRGGSHGPCFAHFSDLVHHLLRLVDHLLHLLDHHLRFYHHG